MTYELTAEQKNKVEQFEEEYQRLTSAISELENQREELLETADEQYAGYLNHYMAYYDDEPLTMRKYFEAINEWDALMEGWNALHKNVDHNDPDVDYSEIEEFEQKTNGRFSHLERVLGA